MSFDNDSGRTHWATCWRDPEHHACAVARVEAYLDALRRIATCAHTIPHSDCASCIASKALRMWPTTANEAAVPEPPK